MITTENRTEILARHLEHYLAHLTPARLGIFPPAMGVTEDHLPLVHRDDFSNQVAAHREFISGPIEETYQVKLDSLISRQIDELNEHSRRVEQKLEVPNHHQLEKLHEAARLKLFHQEITQEINAQTENYHQWLNRQNEIAQEFNRKIDQARHIFSQRYKNEFLEYDHQLIHLEDQKKLIRDQLMNSLQEEDSWLGDLDIMKNEIELTVNEFLTPTKRSPTMTNADQPKNHWFHLMTYQDSGHMIPVTALLACDVLADQINEFCADHAVKGLSDEEAEAVFQYGEESRGFLHDTVLELMRFLSAFTFPEGSDHPVTYDGGLSLHLGKPGIEIDYCDWTDEDFVEDWSLSDVDWSGFQIEILHTKKQLIGLVEQLNDVSPEDEALEWHSWWGAELHEAGISF